MKIALFGATGLTGGSALWCTNRFVVPLFLRWLRPILEDKDPMEAALRASSVERVSARLPCIVAGPEKPVRVSLDGRGIGLTITAASAACFLLARVVGPEFLRAAPSVGH